MEKARTAIQDGFPMEGNATREELMAYHHLLEATRKHLEETKIALDKRRVRADKSSARRAACPPITIHLRTPRLSGTNPK
jgi:hypothetical protein